MDDENISFSPVSTKKPCTHLEWNKKLCYIYTPDLLGTLRELKVNYNKSYKIKDSQKYVKCEDPETKQIKKNYLSADFPRVCGEIVTWNDYRGIWKNAPVETKDQETVWVDLGVDFIMQEQKIPGLVFFDKYPNVIGLIVFNGNRQFTEIQWVTIRPDYRGKNLCLPMVKQAVHFLKLNKVKRVGITNVIGLLGEKCYNKALREYYNVIGFETYTGEPKSNLEGTLY